LLNSILWRTVQRYGVRGYRYCLLDAAHVASNLVRAARACGHHMEAMPGVVTAALENLLDFGHGEALTVALFSRVSTPDRRVPAPRLATAPLTLNAGGAAECPPVLSPLLSRAVAFHRSTLYAYPRHVRSLPTETNDSLGELDFWARERCSAKEFTGHAVTQEQYMRIVGASGASSPVWLGPSVPVTAYVIRVGVHGLPPGIERTARRSATETPASWTPVPAENMTARLLASTRQSIVKSSAFAIVLAADRRELAAAGYTGYRHTILKVGAICAELYREAARCGLGTTTVGGFSDRAITEILGDPEVRPIAIQAFGVPLRNGEKLDAARLVTPSAAAYSDTTGKQVLR
jgi:hypothetical protein